MRKPRPTDEEFAELKRQRNERADNVIKEAAREQGWDLAEIHVHDAARYRCYCACPDGPCQHIWNGPRWEAEDGLACSSTCSLCGDVAMFHSMRCGP